MPLISAYTLPLVLGLVPSAIWLTYFLRKDCHPEPKLMLIKTFLMGIIVSPIAVAFQLAFTRFAPDLPFHLEVHGAAFFLWAALIEELVKLYAVTLVALRNPAFDEPVDAMIYMVTAGLGFAAMENILVMFRIVPDGNLAATFSILTLRFTGATLLHALSSALVGYFLALSWFFAHHRVKLVAFGVALATVFHFTFNTFLSVSDNELASLGLTTTLLIACAFLVSVLFDRIKARRLRGSEPQLT